MNWSDKVDRKSWVTSLNAQIMAFIVTIDGKEHRKYRLIISGLLPEVWLQYKSHKDAINFILHRWNVPSKDTEIITISKLLRRAIRLAENSWLISLLSGVFLIATGSLATTLITNKNNSLEQQGSIGYPTQFVSDCVKEVSCISLLELVQLDNRYPPNFNIGKLTVQFKNNITSEDRLGIRNQGNNQGEVGISGTNVTYEGAIIGSFKGGEGTDPLIITFNTNVTRETAQAVLRNIIYQNTSENPNPGIRAVAFKVIDGYGAVNQSPLTKNIRVLPNKSSIAINAPSTLVTKENSDLPLSNISLNAPGQEKATVILAVSNGILAVKKDVTNSLVSKNIIDNDQKKVILTGTIDQINANLANLNSIIYKGNKGFSGEDYLIINANINNHVNDIGNDLVWPPNYQNNEPISKAISINIVPLNPPPVVNVPGSKVVNENAKLPISGISIKDPNNEMIIVTLEASQGKLNIKTDVPNGIPGDSKSIKNNQTNKVILTSSIIRINNTLANSTGVIYESNQGHRGEDNLKVTASDGQKTSSGNISIIVNDNPILSVPEFVSTKNGIVTKTDAVSLVESWLSNGKNQAFGYTYNQQFVDQYTIGEYRNKSLGKIQWLRDNQAYDRFDTPVVQPVGKLSNQGDKIIIDLKVNEYVTRYVGQNIDSENTRPILGLYRFTLQFEDNSWKIANVQEINK